MFIMKKTMLFVAALAVSSVFFTSCKKDYSCTCTTTVGPIANTKVHDLPNQTHADADKACDRLENDTNSSTPGTTNCHL